MKPTLTDIILIRVELERERQRKLLEEEKIPFDVASIVEDDVLKLAVLSEEFGEVARAVLNRALGLKALTHLQEELIQVAAVAVAWAESLQELRTEISGS